MSKMPIPQPEVGKRRRRRAPRGSRGARARWLAALVVVVAAIAALALFLRPPPAPASATVTGYIDDMAKLEDEYLRFTGQPLKDDSVRQGFRKAARLAAARDYQAALAELEPIVSRAPVPAMYNDLGLLYEQLNDRPRAAKAFREALSRDATYQPVRESLGRIEGLPPGSVGLVTQEIEPNDSFDAANLIPIDAPIDAAISGLSDEDYFRVTAPQPPRDVLEIRLDNRSPTLGPGLAVFNFDKRNIGWGRDSREAGASLVQFLSPVPGAVFYLQVWGTRSSEGNYVLRVHPIKAYDAFEPNDSLSTAARIEAGKVIEANLMDEQDNDYYQFASPRTGKVEIEIENRSTTLVPALSLFGADQRFVAFGPTLKKAGDSLKAEMQVEQAKIYYLQVWAQGSSSGAYRLVVR